MIRLRLRPAHLAPALFVGLGLLACSDNGEPIYGAGDGSGLGAAPYVHIVSGNGQTGATLSVFDRPLVVQVLKGDTLPEPGVAVDWSVVQGGATLSSSNTVTDSMGEASVLVTAGPVLGDIQVQARRVPGVEAGRVFALRTTRWGVNILPDGFAGPFGRDTLEVVAGDTVEWTNRDVARHVLVTRESPEGGVLIRSGMLANSERYSFVPNVQGVWVYEDTLSVQVGPALGAIRAIDRLAVGELRVIVTVDGTSAFGGFVVLIDSGEYRSAVESNASVLFPTLSATTHLVRLLSQDETCKVLGENPRTVEVPQGQRLSILFEVVCS